MKLYKNVEYACYKDLKLNKRTYSMFNRGKMLITFSSIILTSAFNPLLASASSYYEPSVISSQPPNNLSSSEQEKLNKIMKELARIREEVQVNIDIYNNYHDENSNHNETALEKTNGNIEEKITTRDSSKTNNKEENIDRIEYRFIEKDNTCLSINGGNENKLATPSDAEMSFEIINSEDEQRYNIFNEYSGYYGLDTTAVYNLAKKFTLDFSEVNYLNSYVISNTTFYNEKRVYPSEKAGIIAFVRCLAIFPENYGISANDIKTGVYRKYPGSYEQMTADICDILGVSKETMLAIMYHETGYFSSNSFINKNNPAGIMLENGVVKSFDNKEAGIIESIYNVYFRFYESDNSITLEEIGKVYCPVGASNDDGTNINWISGVRQIKEEIENNPEIFENSEKSKGI